MFQALLRFHWNVARLPLLGLAVTTFAVPLMSVQRRQWDLGTQSDGAYMLMNMQLWALAYPLLAVAAGLLLAMTAWSKDHGGNHVYALTLPVERWRYVLTRYRAGATLLAVPALGLGAGALLSALATQIPAGLSIYPLALTLRFTLAAGVAFSVFFAISAGTTRTAGYIVGTILVAVVGQGFLEMANFDIEFLDQIFRRLVDWPGPLDVFGGRWLLIDV